MSRAPLLNWERIARLSLHPVQIRLLELLALKGRISPVQAQRLMREGEHALGLVDLKEPKKGSRPASLGTIAYHMSVLGDRGLTQIVETIQRRGAIEHV